ncbi:Histidine kinase [Mucilaginibacter pineti]|uniref:Histidine kinase n=1 Tax=Mucilaginibacter pineti TaxID=1391627 RepID=A0A1G7L9A3_9SPHI|nr:histidine kinase [Mucilaginibacter pineti]SDF46107.1 Histidine kinase [Mucilaginibacter pineti]
MKKNIQKWFQKYKLHLLIWALFIFYETVVIGLVFNIFGHPITYIAHYTVNLFLFYLHGDLLFPWALKERKAVFWRIPFILFLEVTCFILVSYAIDKSLMFWHIMAAEEQFHLNFHYCLKISYRCLYFLGFATGYYFLITYIKERKKTSELETQHLNDIINNQKSEQELIKAENAFLKAQINPHFLFNTLDTIYHNIDASSPIAANAVIILTEMMRFAVDADKMGDYILLGDEIDQAENLLYLNQMRNNHALGFRLSYTDEVRQIYLIPLVLLTLMENVFKHGNLNVPKHEAVIEIFVKNQALHVVTDNLIDYNPSKKGGGSGLNNIEKRLRYTYGDAVDLVWQTSDANHFILRLSIPLQMLEVHNKPAGKYK